jgi:choline dehydrogenase-like flavoprotein
VVQAMGYALTLPGMAVPDLQLHFLPFAYRDEAGVTLGADPLGVVDASAMPVVPSANTYIPTVAVAEKAADLIARGS